MTLATIVHVTYHRISFLFLTSALEEYTWVEEHLLFGGRDDYKTADEAKAIISGCENRLSAVQQTYMDIQREFLALDLEISDTLEVKKLQQDIDFLKQIWDVTSDWDAEWERWKMTPLKSLDIVDVEMSAERYNKFITKLGKNEKSNWNVLETLSDKIYVIRCILPVVKALRNSAMHSRHWESLKNELQMHVFDPTLSEFNIESILNFNLHTHHAAFMKELSRTCNEEFCIETSLTEIMSRWKSFDLSNTDSVDIAKHLKALNDDTGELNKIRSTKLATAVAFEEDVTHCDEVLNAIRQDMDCLVRTQSNCIDHNVISTITEEATIYTS